MYLAQNSNWARRRFGVPNRMAIPLMRIVTWSVELERAKYVTIRLEYVSTGLSNINASCADSFSRRYTQSCCVVSNMGLRHGDRVIDFALVYHS